MSMSGREAPQLRKDSRLSDGLENLGTVNSILPFRQGLELNFGIERHGTCDLEIELGVGAVALSPDRGDVLPELKKFFIVEKLLRILLSPDSMEILSLT